MNWFLAAGLLVVGLLTGDLVLVLQIIAVFTVGVLVLKWGEKRLVKEVAEMRAKEAAEQK